MNEPSAASRLRLAVIGVGLGSAPHFRSLADLHDEVEVAWVGARSLQRLQALKLPAGARSTTRLDDIFEDPRVQAVLLLTPPNTHLELARRAAAAGQHVLVEKPLEIDLQRAEALVQACERAHVHLAVMLQQRLREAAVRLSALLQSGALGTLISAAAFVRWWRPQSYYDEPGRGTLARDGGGVLMTQAIHTLDLLLSLTGLPERVTGLAGTSALHRMECEDCAAALLQFGGGVTAVVQATTAAYPGYAERIELNCTQGTATLESGELQVQFSHGESLQVGAHAASGGGADPMAFDHAPHRAVLQDFVRAVQAGHAPAITGRSALAVQRVIEAIMDSSRSGASVALGNPTPSAP
jgi:UDP-N-acetyl-2-amino-2-deoxyglucuronate dehydrogenase